MDEFENRLKSDAENIDATISPELRSRIDASLRATEQIRPVPETPGPGIQLWWASSLTGLAAAVIVIVLINWNTPVTEEPTPEPVVSETVPEQSDDIQSLYPPRLKTADFTNPLEEELLKLQADIDRARARVREDVEFSF
jgi:hypothetical protein